MAKKKQPDFKRLLCWLMAEMMDAAVFLDIVKSLNRLSPNAKSLAPFFFELTIGAHADAATMCLNRVLDKTNGTGSLDMLFSLALKQPDSFRFASRDEVRAAIIESQKELVALQEPIRSLRTRRHKTVAHTDPGTLINPDNYIRSGSVTFRQVDAVCACLGGILDRFSRLWFGKPAELKHSRSRDWEGFFKRLESD
jgi:hypothetical protein